MDRRMLGVCVFLFVVSFGYSVNLYATPVWVNDDVFAPNEIKKIRRLISLEKKDYPYGYNKSNVGGWQSGSGFFHKLVDNKIGIMELARDIILRNSIDFVCQHETTLPQNAESKNIKYIEVWIDGGWANINRFQDFNMPHTHPESFIAGTLYLSKRNEGNLVFEDPRDGVIGIERSLFITPKKNRLVLFPAWLKHGVAPNPSKTHKRVSFSFNVQLNYLPDKMQSYQRDSLFCERNFQSSTLECALPSGRYFTVSLKNSEVKDRASAFRLMWESSFAIIKSHSGIDICASKEYRLRPFGTNHTTFFRKRFLYDAGVGQTYSGNDIIMFESVGSIDGTFNNKRASIKLVLAFKDPRRMCSFGFRYTFGCPENNRKTYSVDLKRGESVVFPGNVDYIIEPNREENVEIIYRHGHICKSTDVRTVHEEL